MGVRDASESVERVMNTIQKILAVLKENGSLTGGVTIVKYNPLTIDWRVDFPKTENKGN